MNAFNGKTKNILIISDRLLERAAELCAFLNGYHDITCNLIESVTEYDGEQLGTPDFLISAGILRNPKNYHIIETVRKINSGVFCILWGRVDECIREQSNIYHFNEYFERTLPHLEFLKHLQDLEYQNIHGFAFKESCLYAAVSVGEQTYDLLASDEIILKIRNLGIRPAGNCSAYQNEINYTSHYGIKNGVLYLTDLSIKNHSAVLPAVNGVAPECDRFTETGYLYQNIIMPLSYTGNIILGKERYDIIKNRESCLINHLFGWQTLMRLTLENGKMVECKNMGRLRRSIKKMCMFLPIFNRITTFTAMQTNFWNDIEEYSYKQYYENMQTLYTHYQAYIEDYCKSH